MKRYSYRENRQWWRSMTAMERIEAYNSKLRHPKSTYELFKATDKRCDPLGDSFADHKFFDQLMTLMHRPQLNKPRTIWSNIRRRFSLPNRVTNRADSLKNNKM